MRRAAALAALVGASAVACSSGEGERGLEALETPQFEPEDVAAPSTAPVAAGTGDGGTAPPSTTAAGATAPPATTADASDSGADGGAAPVEREIVSFDDPVGDAVGGLDDDPPDWADLAGASLEREGNAYRLIVRLGAMAPQTAPDDRTMNIATFFDVDGDGSVDHELWLNLGESGWGPVWYDDAGRAFPGEASNVNVVVEADEVRLLFPDVMLDAPDSLRFAVASEFGEVSTLGSSYAHRDDAPDDDAAVSFPG